MHTSHRGTVRSFDETAGVGEVADGRTGTAYFFHCTQLADGTRTIDAGADVTFRLAAGSLGRWEAHDVRRVAASTGSFPCPVCGAPVDGPARAYEICSVCGWEDDPVQFDDPAYAGGANGSSLNDARAAWIAAQRR
jgi:cold shock CspA family protein